MQYITTSLSIIKRLLLLCLISFTAIRYNQTLHKIKNDVSSSQKLSNKQLTNANYTYAKKKRFVVDLPLQNTTNLSLDSNSIRNPTTSNFFDCNNSISKCTYFYPSKFYKYYFATFVLNNNTARHNDTADIPYNIINDKERQYIEWRKEIGFENANLPALDSLSYWSSSATDQTNIQAAESMQYTAAIQDYISLPQNITYIHVHKCGGTSIQGALYKRARLIRNTDIHIHSQILNMKAEVQTYKHSYGGGTKEKKLIWDNKRLAHIDSIAQSQSSNGSAVSHGHSKGNRGNHHTIFTVVRSPISRFLSAIQQVMHYNVEFREKCLFEPPSVSSPLSSVVNKLINTESSQKSKENEELKLKRLRQQTIQCAIQDMKTTNYRKDVHLIPITSHFRLLDDVTVSVFNMEDIQHVLSYLVGQDGNSQEGGNNTSTKVYHARDRSNVDYATSSILAHLSIDDCTDKMIQQICNLYHVDIELMKWLGFSNERALCWPVTDND